MDPVALTAQMSPETFFEVIDASPRKVREMLFSQLGVKAKKKSIGLRLSQKRDERTQKLHERLKEAQTKQEVEVCKELIRNWLYTKRAMLKSALDYLKVPNDNGLVETEIDFFGKLSKSDVDALCKHLEKDFPKEHVELYLKFVDVPHLT